MIPKTLPFITLLGDAGDPPTITGNDTASVSGRTFQSATVNSGPHVIGRKGEEGKQNCYLNSTTRKVASITAQKRTNSSLESGFSFKNCTVIGSGQVYLGRAWGDYSRVVFSYTFMDNIVLAKGWSDWGDQKRDSRVYYGEYKCSGPGANLAGRVPWTRVLTDEEAKPFIEMQFIEGDTWLISP
ncbi:Putative pectinesterase 53 [Glycine soja]|nr:Putative pectinesterase 53 [Glycine soja]